MTQTVTLEMPGELVQRARAVAERTGRHFEDVLIILHAARNDTFSKVWKL